MSKYKVKKYNIKNIKIGIYQLDNPSDFMPIKSIIPN